MDSRIKRNLRQTVLQLLAAVIWGTGFSAQSAGADHVGPFTFTALRGLVAFVALLAVDGAAARMVPGRKSIFHLTAGEKRALLRGAGACGGLSGQRGPGASDAPGAAKAAAGPLRGPRPYRRPGADRLHPGGADAAGGRHH